MRTLIAKYQATQTEQQTAFKKPTLFKRRKVLLMSKIQRPVVFLYRFFFSLLLIVFATSTISSCSRAKKEDKPQATQLPKNQTSGKSLQNSAHRTKRERPEKRELPGYWNEFHTNRFKPNLTDLQREQIAKLEALGYVSGSKAQKKETGILIHDKNKSSNGLNFYTSGHKGGAILMDMAGNILHQWSYGLWDVWPNYPVSRKKVEVHFWRRAHLFDDGSVLAIFEGLGIIKVDKSSNLIWSNSINAHHDLEVMPNGDIYVLTHKVDIIPRINKRIPVKEDFITILSSDGKEKKSVSILECIENSEYKELRDSIKKKKKDIFHTNTLKVLEGRIADKIPAFAKGNILISILKLDTIAVVNLDKKQIVWAYRGQFEKQHDPEILDNGNLLIFDNRGKTGKSRVIEFEPSSMKIKWLYEGTKKNPFYTKWCGSAQRLPNGNTLITESESGRAFEVTPYKEIVWEFQSPHLAGKNNEFIATLLGVQRLDTSFPTTWATSPSQPRGQSSADDTR